MKLSSRTKRIISDNVATCSLLIVLTLIILIGVLSSLSTERFLQNDRQVAHTYQVMDHVRAVISDLKDAETGQRGYLLTGDPAYLQPYLTGKSAVDRDIKTLRVLTLDNLSQQRRLDTLQTLSAKKLAELDQTITLRKQIGSAAALRVVKSGRGKSVMDQARAVVEQMRREEEKLLVRRTAEAERAGVVARIAGSLGAVFSALLIVLAIRFVGQYLRERTRVEAENLRLVEAARDAAMQQRVFLKDVLASVTEGRLALCDTEAELPAALAVYGETISLANSHNLRFLRHAAANAARACGFSEDRIQDLVTSVSEAGMNAVTHGGGGQAVVRTDGHSRVQVWVTDQGKGIAMSSLPQSTLERGYSSAGSLGHGFWLMLKMCDKISLLTGSQGTSVVLDQAKTAQGAAWLRGDELHATATFKTIAGNGGTSASDVKNLSFRTRTY
ncbi:CHASE3 domain-containing protein [Capsulimonas corticalis]|nr:CHASE3 domain-containing protein [Capsulimonas corticalis]